MPSNTERQREAMAIALHDPDRLYARNRGMLKMKATSLREFASSVRRKKKGPTNVY